MIPTSKQKIIVLPAISITQRHLSFAHIVEDLYAHIISRLEMVKTVTNALHVWNSQSMTSSYGVPKNTYKRLPFFLNLTTHFPKRTNLNVHFVMTCFTVWDWRSIFQSVEALLGYVRSATKDMTKKIEDFILIKLARPLKIQYCQQKL